MSEIADRIKAFIVETFLAEGDAAELTLDTELMGEGVLDSLATLQVVAYLE